MERDERVFIIGEDVGVYGGAFGVTRGMIEEFGEERVIDTPISEYGIAGAITGLEVTKRAAQLVPEDTDVVLLGDGEFGTVPLARDATLRNWYFLPCCLR